MFGSTKSGASAYARVGVETGVAAANPHKLIIMLFDGAQVALSNALLNMRAGNVAAKGQAISKAIMIIDSGLRASLDKTSGGEIAANLDGLYEYMGNRLLVANLDNRPEILEEVRNLLIDIRSAWVSIDPDVAPAAQAGTDDALRPAIPRLAKA
ncbi:MAG: fliS [Herminiimonas sp.]|nr:fliS [Herminiimonas sp.]